MSRWTPFGLDVDFYDRVKSLQKRVGDLQIWDGHRTLDQQQQYRDNAAARGFNPDDWFARPNESTHTVEGIEGPSALGADLLGNLKDAHRYASTYGLWAPYKNDPQHLEPVSVQNDGIPFRPAPAAVDFQFTDTTPTGNRGLDANTANQARAREAERMGTVPDGVPPDLLAPDVRTRLPVPETKDTDTKGLAGGQTTAQGPEDFLTGESAASKASNQTTMVQPESTVIPATPGSTSGMGAAIVNAAMAKLGKPYSTSGRFGPNAYDCSGIVVAAIKEAGGNPNGTVSTDLQTGNTPIDLETAYNTPGALLFVWGTGPAGHVEISRGDGTTIGSARGGVQVRQARGRGWTGAALPAGVGAGVPGKPGAIIPASPYPQRISPEDARRDVGFQAANVMEIMRTGATPAGTALAGRPDQPVSALPQAPMTGQPSEDVTRQAAQDEQIGQQVEASRQGQEAAQRLAAAAQGAPPPAPAPGLAGEPSAPSAVAPGETLSAAQQQPGQGAVQVQAGSSPLEKGAAYGRAAAEGREVAEEAERPQLPNPETADQQAAAAAAAGGGSYGNDPDGWIRQAMQIEGIPESEFPWIKMRMMKESGGNPGAVNNWDSNAARGTPSKGLMQFIDGTFQRFKRPGFDDIMNPVHSLVAYMRAIKMGKYKGNFRLVGEMRGGYSP